MLGLTRDSVLQERKKNKGHWEESWEESQPISFPSPFKDTPIAKTAKASGITSTSFKHKGSCCILKIYFILPGF